MRILTPNKLQKKKLKEMILKLFVQYKFVVIRNNGIISLSKSFWHYLIFKQDTIHISEMCTVLIPEKLTELHEKTFEKEYHSVYNRYSHITLELLHHRSKNIVDYLYDEYILVKYGIQKNYCVKNNISFTSSYTLAEMLFNPIKSTSIVLSRFSNAYSKQILSQWKKSANVLNHPVLVSKRLDLWFKQEIKEQLRKYYQIKISFA